MRVVIFFLGIILGAGMLLSLQGYYPVALVEKTPIFYHVWEKMRQSAMHYANVQQVSAGWPEINFYASDNQELLENIKKGTLSFLIEDTIIGQEGPNIDDAFRVIVRERIENALRSSQTAAEGAEKLYGLSFEDFRELVLMPQARRDVLREHFSTVNIDPDQWLAEVKRKKRVRLFFVPYRWNGETVE